MRRFEKLRLLSWRQRRVLLYACCLINIVRLSLWLFPFGVIRRRIDTVLGVWVCRDCLHTISVDFIVWAVSVAGYYAPGGAKCLARAITTQLLLNRYGYSHTFHIGVAKSASQALEAHAWIEYQGKVVVGASSRLDRFTPLSSIGIGK
ncbi:MAG: lasso peptide biosynthesis B2 protein [Cyanobacteria bacterium J06634_6]